MASQPTRNGWWRWVVGCSLIPPVITELSRERREELRFNFPRVCPGLPWPCEMVPFPVLSGVGCNLNVYDLNGSRSRAQTGHRSPDITGLSGHQLLRSCLLHHHHHHHQPPTSSPTLRDRVTAALLSHLHPFVFLILNGGSCSNYRNFSKIRQKASRFIIRADMKSRRCWHHHLPPVMSLSLFLPR